MKFDDFSTRMKTYESVSQTNLMIRTPVILRADGRSFHSYVRGLQKPFDMTLNSAMAEVTRILCNEIQGAVFGYTQSDEISILIQDWKNLNTDRWFGNNVQKMTSISASIATAYFNTIFKHPSNTNPALFDSRVFNIPFDEVTNYFIWRQKDATRNSINSLAQSKFSSKELHGKNTSQVQDMLMDKFNINWNDELVRFKRGVCVKDAKIDYECPIFTQDRNYIEKTFNFDETVT